MELPPRPPMPDLPAPGEKLSPERVLGLLKAASQWVDHLNNTIDAAFPGLPPAPDLSGLSVGEKLALGDQVAAKLVNLAYEINPEMTLERLEGDLDEHTASRDEADTLIAKLRAD